MNLALIALMVIAYPAMFVIASAFGAGDVIEEIEHRFGDIKDDASERAKNLWFTRVLPRIRQLCLVVGGGLAFAVLLAILVGIETPIALLNVIPTALVAGGFSIWLYRIWNKPPEEFSVNALISASFLGFLTMGVVEFYVGNKFHSRGIVQIGTFYLLFALLGMLKQGVRFVVRLASLGVFSLEGMTNIVTSIAIGLVTVGKSSLKDVFGPTGAQIATEEEWEPKAAAAMSRVVAAIFPMLIFCNLLPGMDVLGVMTLAGGAIFMMWGTLEAVGISTKERREKSALVVYRLAYPLLVVVALTLMVPGATAEFDALRVTIGTLVIGMFRGTSGAIMKVMGSLIVLILSGALLYAVWPRGDAPQFPRLRKFAGVFIALAAIWSFGEIFVTFAEPKLDTATAMVKGKYFEKFVPKLSAEKVNDRKAVLVRWFEQPETDSYIVMRRGSREEDQAVFHPILDPNFPGTDRPLVVSQGATQVYDYTAKPGEVYYYQVLALKYSAKPCWNAPRLGAIASFLGPQLVQAGARQPASCDTIESLIVHRSTETEIKVAEEKKAETPPAPTASAVAAVPAVTVARTSTPVAHATNRGYSPEMLEICKLDPDACRP